MEWDSSLFLATCCMRQETTIIHEATIACNMMQQSRMQQSCSVYEGLNLYTVHYSKAIYRQSVLVLTLIMFAL